MSFEYFTIGILLVLLLAQQIYWARICFRLTDRIMSRNYQDFVYGDKAKRTSINSPQAPREDDGPDPVAARQAEELNSLIGVI